jgi:hypothetical protein
VDTFEANILDKTDKSVATIHVPNRDTVLLPKRNRHGWHQGSKEGTFAKISKRSLNIDGRYQRGESSHKKILEIAANWDWALLSTISVAQREDLTLWVFDGGHRARASFYRDDIDLLPCMVYQFADLSEEAKAFLGKNLMVSNVSSVAKYKASVVASDPVSEVVAGMLAEYGVSVAPTASSRAQVKCVGTLLAMCEKDESLARRCFEFCLLQVPGDDPVSSSVLRGLFFLCQHFAGRVDIIGKYGSKLAAHSQKEMDVRIRQTKAECGKGGEKIEALGLLSIINKGLRNKLAW